FEQLPIEITHLGSGIWSYSRRSTGAIFLVTVPATIIRSDWRGEARNTSAPKRAMSYRDAEAAIISMAQQARPNPIGQIDDSRAQLSTRSMLVVMKLSSKRWSIRPINDPSGFGIRDLGFGRGSQCQVATHCWRSTRCSSQ